MSHPALAAEDFDAAKEVFETLKQIPKERQERILRWIAEGFGISSPISGSGPLSPPDHSPTGVPRSPIGSALDIKAFVAAKAPRSDNHFAAVVAYYYRFEAPSDQRRDTIDAKTLQEATRLAGRKRLSKPSVTLNNAKKAGLVDAVGRGAFAVNSVGENLVAMALPGEGSAPPRANTRILRKGGAAKKPLRRR